MANGFTDKEMIERILEGQQGLQNQISLLSEKVDKIMFKGCAHRDGDLLRIANLEKWRDRSIASIISLAITTLLAYIFGK